MSLSLRKDSLNSDAKNNYFFLFSLYRCGKELKKASIFGQKWPKIEEKNRGKQFENNKIPPNWRDFIHLFYLSEFLPSGIGSEMKKIKELSHFRFVLYSRLFGGNIIRSENAYVCQYQKGGYNFGH